MNRRTGNIECRTDEQGMSNVEVVSFSIAKVLKNNYLGWQPKVLLSMEKRYDLEERLIEFASNIIDVSEALPKTIAGNHIGHQLLRSGTSPALNYGEAQSAESRADFIHKMKICLKELRETYNCLRLINKRHWIKTGLQKMLTENNELIAIFVASISTAIQKSRKPV